MTHRYLSAACLHGTEPGREQLHDYCSAARGTADGGETWVKRPAECKWCGTSCVCPCHSAEIG
jgi:hypothetical protein